MRPGLSLICAVAMTVSALGKEAPNEPLPKASETKTVVIKFHHRQDGDAEFTASSKHWKAIRATMLPAKKDNNPSKWESFGDMTITLKDDAKVKVGIYSPSKGPNAFAVGNTVRERVYYRGGNQKSLRDAILKAYEETKK